jgi:hypothetical protein
MTRAPVIVALLGAVVLAVGCSYTGSYGTYYRGSAHYGTGWYAYPRYYRDRPIIVDPGPGLPGDGPVATHLPSEPPMMDMEPDFSGGMADMPDFGMPDVDIDPF